ncbi:hypothetical protein VOLCADRAFT_107375 [Volvox carteri f. nagariensis]|uniref:Protein kinase domain-containing protein n=1 Tax=Volvox carteri f. nagariensis TaxID=3068 RepID=D8UDL2_VOLCA|nr:uncharacterized protein VOLCADRAFT_107375 [Volvox carteri f. nagariensis]EFJ42183.1 hypothetical protein VOLCADRAFT_107375 [Volvox carteri f. nagariensis]|eukprot:XP_002956726.1 hypothetical protein VOLCADRAFT_107375 [Volvox carteri f. nagariensis]
MADSGPTAAASVAQSSIAVPGWAIATAASNIGETASPQSGPGQGTGAVSLEDSQRTYTNSNPTSDQKVARPSAMRNIAVLPLESASGARSRPSANQRLPEHDIEKGSFKLANTESKVSKRTPTNCSPLNSRQQSVVPELPPEWQVAAGIKNSGVSDSTSSCCGRIRSTDGSGTKGATVCSRKRWRACAHSVILEFKKVIEVVHTKPLVLLPGIAVLAIVLGLGLWALIAASSAEERFRHDSATKIATDKALYIQTELDKTFMPAYVVATAVQQDPNYYPTQPANLNQVYKNQWYLVNKKFDKLAGDLIALTKAGSVRTVSAIPHGVIRTMYPLNGTELAHDRNWGAIGKNWLNDSVNAAPVKVSLQSHNLTIIGPYNLVQGGIGIVGMQSIFVNATREDTFGIPPGLVTVLLSWDFLRDNVTNLQDLSAQGYDYVLTRPDKNNTNLAVDWSPGIDPPRPPGFNVSSSGSRPLIYYDLPSALQDPVIVKVPLPNVEWTLYVSRTGGWVPSWKAPLIAMVVILSFVLSLLVFAVLVSRVQQRRLLRDVVEAAGKLASTTRILEDEKNRMQALLARHFDLIDLLEGGAGGLAGSLQGAGGGGAAASGDGARSRIDILRQKMLLTGTSLRREQLGEAEQVTIQEMLGEGTFGKVYKGLWRGTEVAIKTIVLPANMSGKEKREKMAVMEAAISSSLAHPNIVQTYTYHIRPLRDSSVTPCLPPPSPQRTAATPAAAGGGGSGEASGGAAAGAATAAATAAVAASGDGVGRTQILADVGAIVVQLVLEYCDRGCLRDALDAGAFFSANGLNYPAILETAADIAKAMLHLHLNDVLHSDLKATNVMLKSTGGSESGRGVIAKVADFGLSVRLDPTATHMSHAFQGSLTHMAPEVMLQGHISRPADVYAFGITLWEIFTGGQAYRGRPFPRSWICLTRCEAIVVGGRLVSLNAAIHSVESNGGRMMLGGNIAAAGASLGGLGLPGVLETINEEGMGDVSAALPPAPAAAAAAAAGAAGAGVAVEALHRNVTQQQQQQQQMDEGGWAGGGLAPAAVTVAVSREVKVCTYMYTYVRIYVLRMIAYLCSCPVLSFFYEMSGAGASGPIVVRETLVYRAFELLWTARVRDRWRLERLEDPRERKRVRGRMVRYISRFALTNCHMPFCSVAVATVDVVGISGGDAALAN